MTTNITINFNNGNTRTYDLSDSPLTAQDMAGEFIFGLRNETIDPEDAQKFLVELHAANKELYWGNFCTPSSSWIAVNRLAEALEDVAGTYIQLYVEL